MRAILHPHLAEALRAPGALNQEVSSEEQRDDREGHQGQPPVEPEEHGDDAGEQQQVAEDRDDAGGEHLVQGVDVGGHPGDQAADRVAVEEASGSRWRWAKICRRRSFMMYCPMSCMHVALGVEGAEGEDQDRQVEQGRHRQPLGRRPGAGSMPRASSWSRTQALGAEMLPVGAPAAG